MEDDDAQEIVNNAVAGEGADQSADTNEEALEQGDQEHDDATDDQNTDQGDQSGDQSNQTGGDQGDDSGEDDDDDDELDDFVPPIVQNNGNAGAEVQNSPTLDIRNLPRDANGALIPDQANSSIEQYVQQRIQAALGQQTEQEKQTNEIASKLTTQWQRGATKYPHIVKNKDMVALARDMHLNSIEAAKNGSGRYVSPLAALKRVDRMYKKAARSGYNSAKTRTTVTKAAQSETTGGKGSNSGNSTSEYDKARKLAQSTDPSVARQGRMQILALRRAARENR